MKCSLCGSHMEVVGKVALTGGKIFRCTNEKCSAAKQPLYETKPIKLKKKKHKLWYERQE